MAFRFPQGYAAVGAIIDRFLEAILHSTSTFFCGSPTGGCRQNRYHCNKVAPTARTYLHLICRKRHLPLKLRKGKTIGCGAKLSSALMFGEAHAVSYAVPNRATAKLSNALLGCVAVTVSTNVPNRAIRDNRIRSCVKAPLKCDGNVRSGGGNVSKIDGFRAKSAVE